MTDSEFAQNIRRLLISIARQIELRYGNRVLLMILGADKK